MAREVAVMRVGNLPTRLFERGIVGGRGSRPFALASIADCANHAAAVATLGA